MLHPYEYTALRNELDSIWGLQQVTDLVPLQAETLLGQARAGIKTAADIAASSAEAPQLHLPTPGPVPRPTLSTSPHQQPQKPDMEGVLAAPAVPVDTQQSVVGDLYAHSEHGMVRTARQARINSRQQRALQSGLLQLSAPRHRSTAAVLEPPETAAPPSSSSVTHRSSSSAQTAASEGPSHVSASRSDSQSQSLLRPHGDHATLPDSDSSLVSHHRLDQTAQTSSSSSGSAHHNPGADPTPSSTKAISEAASTSPADASNIPGRVIRGRAPRQALAAQKAADAERQKSGSKAGPSGRATADYSFLSADQQRVRPTIWTMHTWTCTCSMNIVHTSRWTCMIVICASMYSMTG